MRSILLCVFALLLAACGATAHPASLPPPCVPCPPSATPNATAAPEARSPLLDDLAHRRVALARKRVKELKFLYDRGQCSNTELLAAYREVAFAARDSGLRGDEALRALEVYRDAAVSMRDRARAGYPGQVSDADVDRAEAALLEAEYWLQESAAQPR